MGTYYSIQTIEAWKQYERQGFLVGERNRSMFLEEYEWLITQMSKRLPNYQGDFPVWLWIQKPNLEDEGHLPAGEQGVLLTLEIPEEQVLLSDFDAWHCVLNDFSYVLNEKEEELEEKGMLPLTKEETWERIFDLNIKRSPYLWGTEPIHVQGTTGKVPLTAVKDIKFFVAK